MVLRYLTAGESHGPALTTIVEGMPAGVQVTKAAINAQLARRQMGYGRGGRMAIEKDQVEILSGVRDGYTLGSPITLLIHNRDWANWQSIMTPEPGADVEQAKVTRPRPGHADLSGAIKYGHNDVRNVLERASARETAARVAACTLGRLLIEQLGISIFSHVVEIGGVAAATQNLTYAEIKQLADQSQIFCADPEAEVNIIEIIKTAKTKGDSLGGIFEVVVQGLPVGIGSHVHWDRKLDGQLAQALMSIQAIKGVEIGLGMEAARLPGSQVHDEITYDAEAGFGRRSNQAGGIEGGMTNGQPVVVRAAMKPIPTLYTPLKSVDLATKEQFQASVERSDVCAVPAASVVGEAVVAFSLAIALLEKVGGDSLIEVQQNLNNYQRLVRQV